VIFSDRFRTLINVFGDSVGAGIVYEMSKGDLEEMDAKTKDAETKVLSAETILSPDSSTKMNV